MPGGAKPRQAREHGAEGGEQENGQQGGEQGSERHGADPDGVVAILIQVLLSGYLLQFTYIYRGRLDMLAMQYQ
jgi:hypothetical protein